MIFVDAFSRATYFGSSSGTKLVWRLIGPGVGLGVGGTDGTLTVGCWVGVAVGAAAGLVAAGAMVGGRAVAVGFEEDGDVVAVAGRDCGVGSTVAGVWTFDTGVAVPAACGDREGVGAAVDSAAIAARVATGSRVGWTSG